MNEHCELRDSVLACERHVLVIGGPGSGKTTLALRKAVKRIRDGMRPGQSALFLSFSRAAVARILDASKLESTKAEQAQLSIQTFHSFFWDILKAHAYLLGAPRKLSILLPQDEKAISGGRLQSSRLRAAQTRRLLRHRRPRRCSRRGHERRAVTASN